MAISVQTLRAEGPIEIGAVPGTCLLYVTTRKRLCLFREDELPRRRLDAYGAHCAAYWIEQGIPSYHYAAGIGVTEPELRRALLSIGYARLSSAQLAHLANARAARKIGNRRGKLVRVDVVDVTPQLPAPKPRRPRGSSFNDKSATAALKKKRSVFGTVLP